MMPALNEERNIASVLDKIPAFIDKIIVVNDGSTDNTADISISYGCDVVNHTSPRGVGMAFQSGIVEALKNKFDILVNMDSDGQFNPSDIKTLIAPLLNDSSDFVTASRFKDKELYPVMPKAKFYGNLFMARFISLLTGSKFYDVSCGFRAYSRDTLLRMNLFGKFTYTQESFLDLAFKNIRMEEIPISIRGTREFGKSRVASNLFRYGYQTLKIIVRSYRDYKPIQLFLFFAVVPFILASLLLGFTTYHFLTHGSFSPYKYIAFTGGFFTIITLLFVGIGFILDMFSRMRINQENLLYELRRNYYDDK